MFTNYALKLYFNGVRINPRRLSATDARFFYKLLKQEARFFELKYKSFLDETSILVSVEGVEMFFDKEKYNMKTRDFVEMILDEYRLAKDTVEVDGVNHSIDESLDEHELKSISTIRVF